jgi:hypothetical protein
VGAVMTNVSSEDGSDHTAEGSNWVDAMGDTDVDKRFLM